MGKYVCSGCTALNDAVCIAIDTVGREFADMPESERPDHVLCVIITDGMENASREYTTQDVKERGEDLGIDHESCMEFSHDFAGVEMLCSRMNLCMDKIRKKQK